MRYLSTKAFLLELQKNKELHPEQKYCFILGAGASVSSGIPGGYKLCKHWLDEIRADLTPEAYSDEIQRRIRNLNNGKDYTRFLDIKYDPDLKSDLDDYNCICELRFGIRKDEEEKAIQALMSRKMPYVGYFTLANIVTSTPNNVVITTNFDDLLERAINDYIGDRPNVINHEKLAEYSISDLGGNHKILKVHRDMYTGGFNRSEETKELKGDWGRYLPNIFKEYTPIVIGYAGTDRSLMRFLHDNPEKGIYWCHMYSELPNNYVTEAVQAKDGAFVEIWEFDHIICHIASILKGDQSFKNQVVGDTTTSNFAGYFIYKGQKARHAIRIKNSDNKIRSQYKQALKRKATPISWRALFMHAHGQSAERKRKIEKAITLFTKAFTYEARRHHRYYGKARLDQALVLSKLGKDDLSKPILEEMLQNDIDDSGKEYLYCHARIALVFSLTKMLKYTEAIEMADILLSQHRCDGYIYRYRAIAEFLDVRYPDALNDIGQAIICHIQDADSGAIARDYLHKGLIAYCLDDLEQSRADFYQVLNYAAGIDGLSTTTLLAKRYIQKIDGDSPFDDSEMCRVMLMSPGQVVELSD